MNSPINETGEPNYAGLAAQTESRNRLDVAAIQHLLCCPIDGSSLTLDPVAGRLAGSGACHSYGIESGIPVLFTPNHWPGGKIDVTDIVKEFYEETPFPNYDGLDSRDNLRNKARADVFARMLDEQIPNDFKILEVGCGTGQMTNFLGMGWNRTAVGADLCMNSLRLAKGFRDRFSINNAHFTQINLFKPPFKPQAFDLVISNGVLHHTSDCEGGFRSISKLVRPGGFIVIGLYNWLGRLPTLWRRWAIDRFGEAGALLDSRLRAKQDVAQRRAWFMDQYKHPHETKHSIDELLQWFDEAGFDFTSCLPTIGDTEFSDDMRLFELSSPGSYLDRLSSEIELLLSGGADGGLYIMIARKRQ
jgi:SAM-dependent methyltransferase